ncbi:MAG: TetR family transcriptional regulator [Acidobacteria bacterium]|nr:TetR family transcriptional regulator [Acidobacteriota bacterium]MBU4306914.1 TetR family transcriptional regulator [Acidobacteriota bacterium]MCG2812488.1 TetR family transcriptional regulator [Candidatus Aminicenantes bacterium]
MKKNNPQTKERILLAAQKEFAARGYSGARMEAIARGAAINKAMLFYYFSSKDNLYRTVLFGVFSEFFGEIGRIISGQLTPDLFLEKFPEIFIRFIARHPDLLRIMVFDLIHNPENVTTAMAEIIHEKISFKPHPLFELIRRWHKQGLVSESDPLHFMMNIVALSIFSFIGKPMVEAISGIKVTSDEDFYRKRIASVVNVLQRGMLK